MNGEARAIVPVCKIQENNERDSSFQGRENRGITSQNNQPKCEPSEGGDLEVGLE
jgi:hypothetical protein